MAIAHASSHSPRKHAIPSVLNVREFTIDGGLMRYGPDNRDAYRHAGQYVARILKGDNPADLAVMQAAKFEFVINLKTARTSALKFRRS
jgi:putative tryptophan/tyrosine transport system substrate-binding protein